MTVNVYNWIISPYMICMLVAFILGYVVVKYFLKLHGVDILIIRLSAWMNIVFIIIFGKLYTILFSYHGRVVDYYESDIINLLAVPFSSMGGMIGLLSGVIVFCRIYESQSDLFWKTYVLILPLLYSVSKVGCHLMGCCYGKYYNGIGYIEYSLVKGQYDGRFATRLYEQEIALADSIPVGKHFPVQICEVIVFAIIFCIFFTYFYKNNSYSIEKLLLLCALSKCMLEFLRSNSTGYRLNANQLFCLLMIAGICSYKVYKQLLDKGISNGK